MFNKQLPTVKFRAPEALENERAVKAEVKKYLKAVREYLYKEHSLRLFEYWPVSNGMGRHGVPDCNLVFLGQWVSIETKHGGKMPTARQSYCLDEIANSGGRAFVIHEKNLDALPRQFQRMYERYQRLQQI
jgi:hypothetical protein